jgi:hypothetical protein
MKGRMLRSASSGVKTPSRRTIGWAKNFDSKEVHPTLFGVVSEPAAPAKNKSNERPTRSAKRGIEAAPESLFEEMGLFDDLEPQGGDPPGAPSY